MKFLRKPIEAIVGFLKKKAHKYYVSNEYFRQNHKFLKYS